MRAWSRADGAFGVAAAALCGAALCAGIGCADPFAVKSGAGGRAEMLPSGVSTHITLERRLPAEGGTPRCAFRAELAGAVVRSAALQTPSGEVLPFQPEPVETPSAREMAAARQVVVVEAPEAELLAAFPNGLYTIEATLLDGAVATVTIFVYGSLPPYPHIAAPANGDQDVPAQLTAAWSGAGDSFAASVLDPATGARTELLKGGAAFSAEAPTALTTGTAFRLEVAASAGLPGGYVAFRSVSESAFRTRAE